MNQEEIKQQQYRKYTCFSIESAALWRNATTIQAGIRDSVFSKGTVSTFCQ
jgi:hypothetical protein